MTVNHIHESQLSDLSSLVYACHSHLSIGVGVFKFGFGRDVLPQNLKEDAYK